jgi:hypothetical protein
MVMKNRLKIFTRCVVIAASLASAAHAGALKPPLYGLISMGDITFHNSDAGVATNSLADIYARPGIFGGAVMNVGWSQLEPAPNSFSTAAIDEFLGQVRAYNRRFPNAQLKVRLRIFGGASAPGWVKQLDGSPINVYHRDRGITVGHFWTDAYMRAWAGLQQALANKYDSEPLIAEVTNSACSTGTDEPFILPRDATSLANLHAAGFNDAGYERCLSNSYAAYAPWRSTRIEFPFNPFHPTDAQARQDDVGVTIRIMQAWRAELGARAVIGNHALERPLEQRLEPIYDELQKLGPVIELQTASWKKGGDPSSAIDYAASIGATAVELWDGPCRGCAFTQLSEEELGSMAANLKRNPPPR